MPSQVIGEGTIKVKERDHLFKLRRPLAGDPFLIVNIQDVGNFAVDMLSIVSDILETQEVQE
jgi:hypothetical protein